MKMYIINKSFTALVICVFAIVVTGLISLCKQRISNSKNVSNNYTTIDRKLTGRIILTLGDSNGNDENGWPVALRTKLRNDEIVNISEGGRTIGFDNCGNPEWNVLRNIESYLKWAIKKGGQKPIDDVVICLGTNDSKACFEDRKDEVTPNLIKLIARIRNFYNADNLSPHIIIVTPPPYGRDSMVPKKALGGDHRVNLLVPQFRDVALQYHCAYVDIYHLIKPRFQSLVVDHVHLNQKGHEIVARAIAEVINDRTAPKPPSSVSYRAPILFWDPSTSSDVIGYEVISGDRIIKTASKNRVEFSSDISDKSVRARDGYGNVSHEINPA